VRTPSGAFYCGCTADLAARIALHNTGKGAKILRGSRPVRLAYARRFHDKGAALSFEAALKKRRHADKARLCLRWAAGPAASKNLEGQAFQPRNC
jgi:putative endonuclease